MSNQIILPSREMPTKWYNLVSELLPDNPPAPPMNARTNQPAGPEDLIPIFPMGVLEQEMSPERWIDIPEEVLEILSIWRPTPLVRARRLEEYLGTPAKIYYKNESVSPPGSHKPNTAVAQAYYNKREGIKNITTETGAGQWGSALSFACNMFGINCLVYMVKVSYEQKPYRKSLMHVWNGEVIPSPSNTTNSGRRVLEMDPDCPGSLGIAISEAVEAAFADEKTKYSLGSVLNHVMLHQTIIGLESIKQFEQIDDYPDVVIGCVGGGSNMAGFTFPFLGQRMRGEAKKPGIRVVAVEPTACPTLTKGVYAYDFGDQAQMTPAMLMYTLGHDFIPAGIHAGGLRYHGDSPLLSKMVNEKEVEAVAYHQNECYEAAVTFARTEGLLPAPETSHAIRAAIDEALKCKETGETKTIAFNYSGHGHFDLAGYDNYLDGKLVDYAYPEEAIRKSMANLPKITPPSMKK
ncbi:MAG: TrpB-like pyridoxal phosphate-dependent enzyme [Candidatus Latescibacteria bacterium]|nr:TrpB-like pyridoxal phosphate-dependent enzyme [Candidatus Latescibacterota bacterium]